MEVLTLVWQVLDRVGLGKTLLGSFLLLDSCLAFDRRHRSVGQVRLLRGHPGRGLAAHAITGSVAFAAGHGLGRGV